MASKRVFQPVDFLTIGGTKNGRTDFSKKL